MISGFIYKVPLVCFAQVGGWFGFVLFFAPIALDKNHRPFQLLNPPCTARSIPGKVHLLWETKSWGRQTAAAAQPCCPIPHPGEGTSPLRGTTSLRTFPLHLPGKGKCHSRLLRARFCIQISLPGHGAGRSPQATSQSVTVCSSAGGKHRRYKWEPGSFPGVISL